VHQCSARVLLRGKQTSNPGFYSQYERELLGGPTGLNTRPTALLGDGLCPPHGAQRVVGGGGGGGGGKGGGWAGGGVWSPPPSTVRPRARASVPPRAEKKKNARDAAIRGRAEKKSEDARKRK
jgi:hypothetical protein